jgi:hypothetical protein
MLQGTAKPALDGVNSETSPNRDPPLRAARHAPSCERRYAPAQRLRRNARSRSTLAARESQRRKTGETEHPPSSAFDDGALARGKLTRAEERAVESERYTGGTVRSVRL